MSAPPIYAVRKNEHLTSKLTFVAGQMVTFVSWDCHSIENTAAADTTNAPIGWFMSENEQKKSRQRSLVGTCAVGHTYPSSTVRAAAVFALLWLCVRTRSVLTNQVSVIYKAQDHKFISEAFYWCHLQLVRGEWGEWCHRARKGLKKRLEVHLRLWMATARLLNK